MTEGQSLKLYGLSHEEMDAWDSFRDSSTYRPKKQVKNIKEVLQKQQQQYPDNEDSSSWDDLAYRDYQSRECSSLLFDIFQPSQGSSRFESQISSSTIIPSQYFTPIKQQQQKHYYSSSPYCQMEDSEDDHSSGGSASTTNETNEEMQQSQQQPTTEFKGRQQAKEQQKVKRVQLKFHIDMLWNAPFEDVKANPLGVVVGSFQQYLC